MPATLNVPPGLLTSPTGPAFDLDRTAPDVAARVATLVRECVLGWPLPAAAPTRDTWRELAALGRADLTVARLVEGHVDALWILAEAGRSPKPGAVYGVWASASGGTGLTGVAVPGGWAGRDGWLVDGTMRYCSGAWFIDRALVVISTPDGKRLADLDVRATRRAHGPLTRNDDSWPAVGMDATRSVDIAVRKLRVAPDDVVGGPGFYLDRPGFAAGGIGVAAVWLGGAAGVLDDLLRSLTARPGSSPPGSSGSSGSTASTASVHQRALLGVIGVAIAAADAVLAEVADQLDRLDPPTRQLPGGWTDAGAARSAVERAVETVLQRAPRISGATGLCRDATFAHRLADLAVYVRQHHAEADYEELGSALLDSGTLLGRVFS